MAELGGQAIDVRYTNAVRCHPDGNRDPTKEEIANCSGWLIAEIMECQPRVIIAFGKIAQYAIDRILNIITGEIPGLVVVNAWHPAYVLRNPKKRGEWREQIKEAVKLAEVGKFHYEPKVYREAEPWEYGEPDWSAPYIGIDTETDDGEEHWNAQLVCWQVADERQGLLIRGSTKQDFQAYLSELGTQHPGVGDQVRWGFWNAKYDAPILGVDLRRYETWEDWELGAYVLRLPAGLKNFAHDYLGLPMVPITTLIGTGKKRIPFSAALYGAKPGDKGPEIQAALDRGELSPEAVEYGVRDAIATARAGRYVHERLLAEPTLERYYREIEKPTCATLLEMERAGVMVDADALVTLGEEILADMAQAQKELLDFDLINPNSHPQVEETLKRLGVNLEYNKETGSALLNADMFKVYRAHGVIAKNWDAVACIDTVLDYRKAAKIGSTYIKPLLEHRDSYGRIHARFNQTVTDTNRLSSSNPNLQNIPAEGKMGLIGKRLRQAFIPRPGYVMVVGDYAQLEMRLFAEYTQEPILLEAFADPENDVHQMLADRLGLSRTIAKTIFYGVLYGAEENKVASVVGARDPEEARNVIRTINSTVPSLFGWKKEVAAVLRACGYVETKYGWRNYYPLFFSPLPSESSAAQREAANMYMQGTAATIAKLAMREGRVVAQRYDAELLLQVHDELVYEVPEGAADEFAREMSEVGSQCAKPVIQVPLIFECKTGLSWEQAKGH